MSWNKNELVNSSVYLSSDIGQIPNISSTNMLMMMMMTFNPLHTQLRKELFSSSLLRYQTNTKHIINMLIMMMITYSPSQQKVAFQSIFLEISDKYQTYHHYADEWWWWSHTFQQYWWSYHCQKNTKAYDWQAGDYDEQTHRMIDDNTASDDQTIWKLTM